MNATYKQVKSISNTRTLNFKFLPATSYRGSRVKIHDKWFKKSIIIPTDGLYNSACEIALAYLIDNGWSVMGCNSESQVIYMSEWNSDKQLK